MMRDIVYFGPPLTGPKTKKIKSAKKGKKLE